MSHVFERKAERVHDSLTALATTDPSPDPAGHRRSSPMITALRANGITRQQLDVVDELTITTQGHTYTIRPATDLS